MTLQELQKAIAELEKQNEWLNNPDQKMTFIIEELGEVAKWVRQARSKSLTAHEREELNFEIADVLQHIVSLANDFDLDIEQGLIKKKNI